MDFIISVFIFLFVLFLYIHITSQHKKSEELEIYETDYKSNNDLQEVCDLKQPFLFKYKNINPEFFDKINDESIANLGNVEEVKVKEINDYWNTNGETVDYVVLPLSSFQILISTDNKSRYFTENNWELAEGKKLNDTFQSNDKYFKPYLTIQTKYDVSLGSKNVVTPMRYHTNYRNFLCVNTGKIAVKMTPFKSSKYLESVKDFENYEFWSRINVWNPQEKYQEEAEKIKYIEFDVLTGNVLYIPPYWWYSIKYVDEDTVVTGFTYISLMNFVANMIDLVNYFVKQTTNTNKCEKTIDVKDNNLEIDIKKNCE